MTREEIVKEIKLLESNKCAKQLVEKAEKLEKKYIGKYWARKDETLGVEKYIFVKNVTIVDDYIHFDVLQLSKEEFSTTEYTFGNCIIVAEAYAPSSKKEFIDAIKRFEKEIFE